MITTEGLATKVQFGCDGKGTIGICVRGTGTSDGLCSLQMLNDGVDIEIGAKPKLEDIKELPRVELHFKDPRSIDALIECLQKTKYFMEFPYGAQAYAC